MAEKISKWKVTALPHGQTLKTGREYRFYREYQSRASARRAAAIVRSMHPDCGIEISRYDLSDSPIGQFWTCYGGEAVERVVPWQKNGGHDASGVGR